MIPLPQFRVLVFCPCNSFSWKIWKSPEGPVLHCIACRRAFRHKLKLNGSPKPCCDNKLKLLYARNGVFSLACAKCSRPIKGLKASGERMIFSKGRPNPCISK